MFNPMQNLSLLVADADQQLAKVFRMMLHKLGFEQVESTRSGREALEHLREKPVDFLITEWNLQHVDGIELLKHIRRDIDSPNPVLPVIMLTGRAEREDVIAARDSGINEFVVKPFSAKTIYNRIERLIEYPRQFVIAEDFVGPDRRHKGTPPPGISNRRIVTPAAQDAPKDPAGAIRSGKGPRIWKPDFSLRRKLGLDTDLQTFITPNVLDQAQASIDAISNDSLQWIKENMAELNTLHRSMADGKQAPDLAHKLSETALTLYTRAGTFGYHGAAEVAYMLYLFSRNRLDLKNHMHHTVVQKHNDVLRLIFANHMQGISGVGESAIIKELHKLVEKYTT